MEIFPSYGGELNVNNPIFFAEMKEHSWVDDDYTVHLYHEPTLYVENPVNGRCHVVATTKTLRRAKKLARKATLAKIAGKTTISF